MIRQQSEGKVDFRKLMNITLRLYSDQNLDKKSFLFDIMMENNWNWKSTNRNIQKKDNNFFLNDSMGSKYTYSEHTV